MATPTKPLNSIESPSNFTLPLHLNLHDDIKPTTNKEDISSTPDKPSPSKDVYRIPSYSSWFSWDKIHETECKNLPEFFDEKNTAKNAMVYKEYRDLMMSKCKENPLRKITFTEVRRMLVGDVNTIRRVFDFLENWGLINYQSTGKKHGRGDDENGAASNDAKRHGEVHRKILCNLCGVDCSTVRFDGSKEGSQKAGDECISKEQENSAINKNLGGESKSVPQQETDKDVSRSATKEPEEEKIKEENIEVEQNVEKNSRPSDQLVRCPRCDSLGTKFCYYNNYNLKQPRHFCKNCQRHWTVGGTMRNVPVGSGRRKGKLSCSYYWYAMKPVASTTNKTEPSDSVHHRAGFVLCANCYSNGNFGPGLSASDFKRVDMKDANQHKGVEWTDNETLLLLQALLAYKDDWKSVAHCVGTKSEAECVAKFVQLPIGEQYINDDIGDRPSSSFTSENSVISHVGSPKDLEQEMVSCDDKNCLDEDMSSSLWPKHLTPLADANNPIMAEASFLAAMAGPHIAEIAARAAINALGQDSLEMLDITTEVHKVFEPENSSAAADKEGPEKDPVAHDEQQHNNNNDNLTMAEAKGNDDMDIATEHIAEANGGKKKRSSLHDAMKFKTALLDAKSSVDEEYKNTELLYSSIVDNQIIKLQEDLETFEELEKVVEKEKLQLKQIEDLLVADRIRLVQEIAKEMK